MTDIKLQVDKFIPFGTTLKEVLNHPSLTDSKLRFLLRKRGIYLEDFKSSETYPLLLSIILSPVEFEFIKEHIRTKESNHKILSRPLPFHSDEDLLAVVSSNLDLKKLGVEINSKEKVISQTNFHAIDGNRNKVRMTYKCETNNYNSSWYRTKAEYDGEIIIEKVPTEEKVYLRIIYTSPETLSVGDLGVKQIVKEFKDGGYTKTDSEIERILYGNFNNEERVKFFLSLTGNTSVFTFERSTDLDIAPDLTIDLPVDLTNIMSGKVKSLKINGDSLHEHYLIKEKENHKYIELAGIEVLYQFNCRLAEGTCLVRYEFAGYLKRKQRNIEFSLKIENITLDDKFRDANKEKVKLFLLQEFETFKIAKYNALKP